MMQTNSLVPARFLLLLGHLVLTIVLFDTIYVNIQACLPESYSQEEYKKQSTSMTVGLSFAIILIVIELLGFLFGVTMFLSSQQLISIFAHGSACILLAYFIFDEWPCDYYWWIFSFCSAFPAFTESLTILGFCLNWKL